MKKHKEKPIKCDMCGKFIGYNQFDKKNNKVPATIDIVPDTAFTTETIVYRCNKCTEEYGPAEVVKST